MSKITKKLAQQICATIVLVIGFAWPLSATAQSDAIVLTVSINTPSMNAMQDFSLLDLDALEQTEVRTANDFVDGEKTFSGPRVTEVLKGLLDGSTAILTAANEYEVEMPLSDFREYPVILATRMSGDLLSVRDKGPIWVIYPMSDYADLDDKIYNTRLIWQLRKLEVR